MSSFTCLTCQVAFLTPDGQRDHFRSDWHRYNLMRKVAELPPVSRELYNERVGQIPSQKQQENGTAKIPCEPCKKTFATQNAFDNHIKSKKHMEMVVSEASRNKKNRKKTAAVAMEITTAEEEDDDDDDIEVEEVDSDEWEGEAVELLECILCGNKFDTLEDELTHLTEVHTFFIPDLQYCVDVPGLITYCGEKIGCGYECLSCTWTAKRNPSVSAVRKHMQDKCHGKIVLEGEGLVEFADFYDYSSSYPDAGEGVSGEEEVPVADTVLSCEGFELVLPSGTAIGHRSLQRYYRQKLDPRRHNMLVKKKQPGSSFHNLLAKYRSLGWPGATKTDVVRKQQDIKYMTKLRSKHALLLSSKGNKLFVTKGRGPCF